jgi:hypothetical protein
MKLQRLCLALLAINLVLLTFSLWPVRSSAAQGSGAPLRVRALELVDANGEVRSRLNVEPEGEVVFRLYDQTGSIRVKLGAGRDGPRPPASL